MKFFPEISESVGSYEIVSLLGKDRFLSVFKSKHIIHNKFFVLKVLSSELINNDNIARNKYFELVKKVSNINHENIEKVIDVSDKEYLTGIFDYFEGYSLDRLLKRDGKFSPLDSVSIIISLSNALRYALEQDITHNDIKPENIIVDENLNVKLVNFGLSEIIYQTYKYNTITENTYNDPFYLSPERFVDPVAVNYKSDLYSLGAVFYNLITGKMPYQSISQIISKHELDIPALPEKYNTEIDSNISNVIMKLLNKNSSERYQSYSELLRDLKRIKFSSDKSSLNKDDFEQNDLNRVERFKLYQKYFRKFDDELGMDENVEELNKIHNDNIINYDKNAFSKLDEALEKAEQKRKEKEEAYVTLDNDTNEEKVYDNLDAFKQLKNVQKVYAEKLNQEVNDSILEKEKLHVNTSNYKIPKGTDKLSMKDIEKMNTKLENFSNKSRIRVLADRFKNLFSDK